VCQRQCVWGNGYRGKKDFSPEFLHTLSGGIHQRKIHQIFVCSKKSLTEFNEKKVQQKISTEKRSAEILILYKTDRLGNFTMIKKMGRH